MPHSCLTPVPLPLGANEPGCSQTAADIQEQNGNVAHRSPIHVAQQTVLQPQIMFISRWDIKSSAVADAEERSPQASGSPVSNTDLHQLLISSLHPSFVC